ncbi:tetratricopeptide repeat-containing sensor histidine kinase [Chryseobacterium profundimaris]|uniref:Tetratricopeptide repeat-containing protein n=1 Tax=Chryseobacterium profundimaris TaxID=1387275 RepID=A0ABY1NK69_9FLAO|nr:histidine kinase [Chryseobacterium profundimaris]SMP11577.1 Tetratricopeptide repeat-containing protein [Chryseobacterium profundimaris]
MKKNYCLIFLFFLFSVYSQYRIQDSLQLILSGTSNTAQKALILNRLSESYKTSDPYEMQKFARQALYFAKSSKDIKEELKAYQNLGTSEIILGDYNSALKYFNLTEQKIINLKSNNREIEEILAKTFGSKGIIFSEQNKYAQALANDFKALKIYEKYNIEIPLSKIYNNVGVVYRSIDDQEKALLYFIKSYKLQKKIKSSSLGATCSNIGLIYLHQNAFDKAKKFFDEGLKEFAGNPNPRDLGELYNNISQYYVTKKQPATAKEYLYTAEQSFNSIGDQFGLSDTYLFMAEIYFNENNLNRSFTTVTKSLEISKKLDLPETYMRSEALLSKIFDKKGDKENALIHLKNYNTAKEKLAKIENAKERIRTELIFESEKQQMEEKERADSEKIKLFLFFLLLGFLLTGTFFFYRNREKEKTILLQKQLTEFQHKALHLQMNPHFVFNCLAAISSFIMQNDKEDAIKYLAKFSKLMRLTLDFSKESFIAIDKEIEALTNYLELEQLRFNKKFDFKIIKDPLIEDDTALPSLLLQPYVENAVIHGVVPKAGKGFIKITFRLTDDVLVCEIEDDGVRIEISRRLKESSVNIHKSMALEISQKRLETLEELIKKKIRLTIEEIKTEQNVSEGTKVKLELPLKYIKD